MAVTASPLDRITRSPLARSLVAALSRWASPPCRPDPHLPEALVLADWLDEGGAAPELAWALRAVYAGHIVLARVGKGYCWGRLLAECRGHPWTGRLRRNRPTISAAFRSLAREALASEEVTP
jgi:hypothetical protein